MKLWAGNPECWTLGAIPWDLFVTLTFRGISLADKSTRSSKIRVTQWFAFHRRFCRQFGITCPRLLWALRQEQGEVGGRMHLHALIGGVPLPLVNERTCFWLMHQWSDDDKMCNGWARCRVVDDALAGAEYACKGLLETEITASHAYETTKFRDSDQIVLSKSVVGLLRSWERQRLAVG